MTSSAGDDTIEQIVMTHYDTLLRVSYQHTGNRAEAEDIVQESFIKLLNSRRGFTDGEHLKAWLIRVTINLCNDFLRSARHKRNISLSDNEDIAQPEQHSTGQDFFAAISKLPPKYRDAMYLHFYEGYSIRETADILKKNANTIASWLRRACIELKEVMTDEY